MNSVVTCPRCYGDGPHAECELCKGTGYVEGTAANCMQRGSEQARKTAHTFGKPLKEKELRDAADCAACGKKVGESGLPFFYRVTIERHGVLLRNVQRQDGLAAFLGSTQLANVMGADEDMTMVVMEPKTVSVCEPCSTRLYPLALLCGDAE